MLIRALKTVTSSPLKNGTLEFSYLIAVGFSLQTFYLVLKLRVHGENIFSFYVLDVLFKFYRDKFIRGQT